MRSASEELVAVSGTPQHWAQLLKLAEAAKALSDHQTMDINRIKLMTGLLKGDSDYFLLATLAIQLGFPSEAVGVIQKGFEAKVLSGDRANRLMNLAKSSTAADLANLTDSLALHDDVPAALARPNPHPAHYPTDSILSAELVYLSPALPDTLILNEVKR